MVCTLSVNPSGTRVDATCMESKGENPEVIMMEGEKFTQAGQEQAEVMSNERVHVG